MEFGDAASLAQEFSALAARAAPPTLVGTGLTLMTAVGFGLTIGSISLLGALAEGGELRWLFVWLLPGPVLGVIAMLPLWRGEGTHAG